MERLDGRVAFITGAARGMGRAEAVKLAQLGADIIAVDLCQQLPTIPHGMAVSEDLQETVRLVERTGRNIVARHADVRELAHLEDALEVGVQRFGRLDIVVANAGVWSSGDAVDMPLESYHDVIDVILHGSYYTCRAAIPYLVRGGRGGSIIIISSTSSTRGAPRQVAYNIAKAGQTGLMVSLANELGQYSIRVNTVNPSATLTSMINNSAVAKSFAPNAEDPTIEDFGDVFTTLNLLPTPWCQPEDIAAAVAWLAADDSRYVTGIQLPVDAGYLARF